MSILDQQPALIRTTDQPTAVVRERVPMANLREFFGRAFGAVMAAAQAQNTSPTGPPFAMYHGMPTDTVEVEAGFPVSPDFSAAGEVISGLLPASDAIEAVHKGPYDTLERTYSLILERMSAEGMTPSQTMWEFYLSDPVQEPDPAKWQTRVVWPII
ncbi:GyrI-like domain-containing protein [Paenarthrobacter histidinolovorans]|uniref:Effector-binding domain-containing protein n=1 Tax=Paenarthrobacter histidinolovorans TaxID=43664 RepID=A0ABW8N726_9MICC